MPTSGAACESTPAGEERPPGGEEDARPGDTEVEGKQDRDRDRDVEVQGEQATRGQATAPSVVAQVPTAVDAGISAGPGPVTSPVPLLVSLMGLMLAAAGWVVRRRRARSRRTLTRTPLSPVTTAAWSRGDGCPSATERVSAGAIR